MLRRPRLACQDFNMVARSVGLGQHIGLALRAAAAAHVQIQPALAGRLEKKGAVTATASLVIM